MTRHLIGRRGIATNGFASYDIPDADAKFLFVFASALQQQYPLMKIGEPMFGLEGAYIDAILGTAHLTIAWDIWSGCFLFAKNAQANRFISDSADTLDTLLAGYTRLSDETNAHSQ